MSKAVLANSNAPYAAIGEPNNVVTNNLPTYSVCPPGAFVKQFQIQSNGDFVGKVKGTCSDGTPLAEIGGGSDVMGSSFTFKNYDAPATGWDSINGYYRGNRITLLESGGKYGNVFNATCPAGLKLSGFDSYSGWWVDTMRFYCNDPNQAPPPASLSLDEAKLATLLNSKAKIFLAKNVPLMPVYIKPGTPSSTFADPDGSIRTSTIQPDGSVITVMNYDDGSSVSSTTVNKVTTNNTGTMAMYNSYSKTAKTGGILLLLLVIIVVLVVLKKKKTVVMMPTMAPMQMSMAPTQPVPA